MSWESLYETQPQCPRKSARAPAGPPAGAVLKMNWAAVAAGTAGLLKSVAEAAGSAAVAAAVDASEDEQQEQDHDEVDPGQDYDYE